MSDSLAPLTVIVTGGRSTRMGSDKALVRYAARPQIERSVRLGWAVSPRVIVACRQEQRDAWASADWTSDPRVSWALDAPTVTSPFRALYDATASTHATTRFFLLGVDMPLVSPKALGELAASASTGAPVVCFRSDDGEFEPFPSLWQLDATTALTFRRAVETGRLGFRRFYEEVRAHAVEPTNRAWLANVNTPEHACEIERLLGERDDSDDV